MKTLINLVVASSLVLSLSSVAHADSSAPGRSEKVQYSDLELAQDPAGVYRRIQHAVADVCRSFESNRSLKMLQIHAECMQLAMQDAVLKVDRPSFTAYVHAQEGRDSRVRLASAR